MPDAPGWYVIQSKPRQESRLFRHLCGQGWEVFFPTVRVHPTNPRAARERAYFSGYGFVRLDLEAVGASWLRWLPGDDVLDQFGVVPAAVPNSFIVQLRRRIAEIRAAGGLVLGGIRRGDRVRITSGPFSGYEAVFDLRLNGADRVRLLLHMLRGHVPVEINASTIERARPK